MELARLALIWYSSERSTNFYRAIKVHTIYISAVFISACRDDHILANFLSHRVKLTTLDIRGSPCISRASLFLLNFLAVLNLPSRRVAINSRRACFRLNVGPPRRFIPFFPPISSRVSRLSFHVAGISVAVRG